MMTMRIAVAFAVLLLLGQPLSAVHTARAAEQATADPENMLYVDLVYGRVVIHMRPDLAPKHVERIKYLVRNGFYDGVLFHRVIAGFMAQTGDPKGTGTGGSGRTLAAEFTRTPQVRGVVSMARTSDKDSADSQWFIVLGDSRSALDGKYTAWGEVISGMEFVDMIHKGDSGRDGKVANPDRLVRMQVAADADRASTAKAADPDLLKAPDAAADAKNFAGAEFRCGTLFTGAGVTSRSVLAQMWVQGYLAGSYKAQNKLTFADASLDAALFDACKAHSEAFLVDVTGQVLAKVPRPLPAATGAFSPELYTCADYVAARGANTAQADFADLWGFAFIQGYKNVGQPNLELPFDIKPQLLTTIAGACAKNPTTRFIELTELMASKVKLK